MKRLILFVVVAILLVTSSTIVSATEQEGESAGQSAVEETATIFKDIQNHWAKEAIISSYEKGLVTGFPDGTFRPDHPVTAGQFAKMLFMAFSEKRHGQYRYFVDDEVTEERFGEHIRWNEAWFKQLRDTTRYNLVTQWHFNRKFQWEDGKDDWAQPWIDLGRAVYFFDSIRYRDPKEVHSPMTRGDVASVVREVTQDLEEEIDHTYARLLKPKIKDESKIDDKSPFSPREAIYIAVLRGVMVGDQHGNFHPNKNVTRAEALTVIDRILHPEKRKPVIPDLKGKPYIVTKGYRMEDKIMVFSTEERRALYLRIREIAQKSGVIFEEVDGFIFIFKTEEEKERMKKSNNDRSLHIIGYTRRSDIRIHLDFDERDPIYQVRDDFYIHFTAMVPGLPGYQEWHDPVMTHQTFVTMLLKELFVSSGLEIEKTVQQIIDPLTDKKGLIEHEFWGSLHKNIKVNGSDVKVAGSYLQGVTVSTFYKTVESLGSVSYIN